VRSSAARGARCEIFETDFDFMVGFLFFHSKTESLFETVGAERRALDHSNTRTNRKGP